MEINKKVSFYKNKTITDDMIMKKIGVVTYTQLSKKFPEWFTFYNECKDILCCKEGNIPSEINLFISQNPYEIKKDIILTICGEKIDSNNSYLCNLTHPPKFPLIEDETSVIPWIFICIVLVSLIFISLYVVLKI